MTTKDTTGPGPASAPDLDVWRAEAGAALEMARVATPHWTDKAGYNNAGIPTRFLAVPGANDGSEVEMIAEDSLFAVAARTGWPRDAARVARLCTLLAEAEHNVRTLRAALAVAERAASLCAGEVVEARTAAAAPTRGSLINALASTGAARVEAAAALRRAPLGPRTEEAQIKALAAVEAEERARAALDAFERADREADPCPGSRGF